MIFRECKVINICFHGIGKPERELQQDEAGYWIEPELYEETLDEVAHRTDVRISFDDGNRSDIEIGLPGLLRRGLTATFFALAGRLGQRGSLSATDLRELRRHGMTIGTHGMDHLPWRGLDDQQTNRELVEARLRLAEAAGTSITEAALPLGRYDRRVLGKLWALGYARVYSSDRIWTRADAWLQPRYSIHNSDSIGTVRSRCLATPSALRSAKVAAVGLYKRTR
ncbi:polysaccharide deacetylase family protein [Microlunatus panaciterrae]|uniref:Peptidoglycan/xylan/chitin deacetylase (PgdA/CDA1 family) n=1 Tax=Microlunatus panaciterrae TaxID=400768 RepID=A0ABS2RHK5_9ACTN|nr:polysaccharide deacetylase family protein [Microlunatus panaciterrae]MBM7798489.1 peptidoglycan/xylan/chitin deacetylase (PgdA/CDA1 family) [Microlunatus panaciterrae]